MYPNAHAPCTLTRGLWCFSLSIGAIMGIVPISFRGSTCKNEKKQEFEDKKKVLISSNDSAADAFKWGSRGKVNFDWSRPSVDIITKSVFGSALSACSFHITDRSQNWSWRCSLYWCKHPNFWSRDNVLLFNWDFRVQQTSHCENKDFCLNCRMSFHRLL